MSSVLLCVLIAIVAVTDALGQQPLAPPETRAATTLERDVRDIGGRGGVVWIGYRAPMVAGQRQMCCYDTISAGAPVGAGVCRLENGSGVSMNTGDFRDRNGSRVALEPATEFVVLVRLENGAVTRVRTFTPDCELDAAGVRVVWLTGVRPDESVAWLSSLVTASPDGGERHDRVGKTALTAVALHSAAMADRALEELRRTVASRVAARRDGVLARLDARRRGRTPAGADDRAGPER